MSFKNRIMTDAVIATVWETLEAGDFSYSTRGRTYDGRQIESIVAAVVVSEVEKSAKEKYNARKYSNYGLGRSN